MTINQGGLWDGFQYRVIHFNVGTGTTEPGSKLQVNGNGVIGYSASTAGPSNGLAISGYVGIGTIWPDQRLQIAEGNLRVGEINPPGTGSYPGYGRRLYFSGGPAPGINYNSENSDPIWMSRYNGASDSSILVISVGDGSSSFDGVDIGTTDNSGGYSSTMSIKTNGNVGIGVGTPTHLIQLKGGAYCDGTGDWIPGSDLGYKKDVDYDFKYGLREVQALRPVYYVHKEDKTNKKQIGFIAQDVLKIMPEVVSGNEGAFGLSYGRLTAVLVQAVKEQQAEIEELKQEIAELKKH